MKIKVEIPKRAERRTIVLLAGTEGIAVKRCDDPFIMVKTEPCNRCGKCCQPPLVAGGFPKKENGECLHLVKDGDKYECGLGPDRPRVCCFSDPVIAGKPGAEEICSIRYEKIKVK